QQRQWFLWQLEPQSAAYNMPTALRFKGELDIEALRSSFETLIARHEPLRTTFRQDGEQAVQVIQPGIDFALAQEELDDASEALIQSKVEEEVARPFDLENGPLLRVKLLRLAKDDHVLVLTLHHIVSDGWSMPIMVDELVQLYEGNRTGQQVTLPELPIQYADYAIWQRSWMEAGEQERQLAYWKAQLGDEQPVLELPIDRPRPAIQSQEGANFGIEFNDKLAQSLKQLAQQQGVSLFMLLLASFQTLLHRYSGQSDIRVGVPNANRNRVETERLIGFFVNTQVLKAEFDLGTTFSGLLQQVQQAALGAQEHQDLPFEQLVEALHPERSLSYSPLFQVMFNHQSQVKGESRQLSGLIVEGLSWEKQTAQFDLALDTFEHNEGIGASLIYATALFDKPTIERLARHWINLLQGIVKAPDQRVAELPLLSAEEQQQIVYDWNRTEASYPTNQCIHQLIEVQASKTPDAVAVVFGEQELTYQQLNQRSNQLAHKLRELGVGPDVLVGIAVERSLEMVIGLLAILKAGGAYVPLDPDYPQDRLTYMMEDSGIQLLLSNSCLQEQLPDPDYVQRLELDQRSDWLEGYSEANPENIAQAENLAYVIYTSGSTGQPKGVVISHAALSMHLISIAAHYGIREKERVLQFASLNFDAASEQIWESLAHGAILYVGNYPGMSYLELSESICRHAVSFINLPPAYLLGYAEFLKVEGRHHESVRVCVVGGEVWGATLSSVLDVFPNAQFFNAYGPTETVITPLSWKVILDDTQRTVAIGRAIGNRVAYIFDGNLKCQPVCVVGEIFIAGGGLARGYHRRPALTAERFIPDIFDNSEAGGGRLYRTGDLARYRTDGVIEYIGRIDHQVKIRGFRIELGEIEAQLQSHEAVREAVVIDIEGPSGKQLVAYLVADAAQPVDLEQQATLRTSLRDYLKESLPDYMVPANLLFLDRLPLTPNGKLDRKALPKPDASQLQQAYVAPQSDLEQHIAAIWADVLRVEKVGLTDNFFELGGHSLLATQVVSRIRQALNIELPLRILFEAPVLAEFVAHVGQGVSSTAPDFERVDRTQPLALSYAQQRQWFLWQLEPQSAAYNMPTALRFKGELDIEALRSSFETLITRHESLRTTFRQDGEQAVQVIQPGIDLVLDQEGLEAASEALIQSKVEEEVGRPFDLENGPLLRVKLLRLAKDDHVLILTLHHIVSDGWSMPIMVDELVQLYEGNRTGQQVTLPELPIQYVDYAIWQRNWMEAGEQKRQLTYWKAQLGDEQPVLELPTDRPRPAIQSQEGANFNIELNEKIAQSLKQLAQQQGVTLFMLLLASFQTLLYRYSGQDDIRVGVPNANRNRVETERLIGFFVNTQVLKAEFDLGTTFSDLLKQVQQTALGAQAHQDLPFEQLVEALHPERSLSHSPLFQVMYNHQTQVKGDSRRLPGLTVEGLSWEKQTTQFDLTLDTFEHEQGIVASLSYATALFDKSTIEQLAQHWLNLLQSIVKTPGQRIAELPMLAEAERCATLGQWDNTHADYPSNRYVHQLIEEQVRQTPNAVAVIFNDQPLTYRELDAQANRLAHKLIEMGVGPEVRVAIGMRRSAEIMVAFLAVLKAGGAYVPLDVAHPRERLLYMMEDCKAALVLTQSDLLDVLAIPQGLAIVLLDKGDAWSGYPNSAPAVAIAEDNLAYVIYTSGSTGQPKGVAVSHGPLVAHIQAIADLYETGPADCELHFMSFAFDGSHEGWMPALAKGARVLIRDDSLWLPEYTYAQMHRHKVTIGIFPPVYLQQLAEHAAREGNPPSTRIYCFGGDAVPQASYELARKALRPDYIVNGYGPTETVVTPLLWKAGKSEHCGASYAPIGRLVGRRRGYVLGNDLSLLPAGFAGELYLGGHGVARGYLDRPGLTAERFVPDPFGDGGRVYRSGDLTRTRADGVVDYLGRIDYQVKIRGFRIELGEIEARLQEHEVVREAVVIDIEGPTGKQLAAYLVPTADQATDSEQQGELRVSLRDYLKEVLPDYMVPAHLLFLDKLPLTPNGKLDRKALPKPDASQLQQEYVAPQSELEQQIASIWANVLKVENVGLTDNFFELGGDSIISIQVVSRARQAGIHFTPKELFQHQTVQGLAAVACRSNDLAIDQGAVSGLLPLTPIARWFFEENIPERHHWNQSVLLEPRESLDFTHLKSALQALLDHHDALRLRFELQQDRKWIGEFQDIQPIDMLWSRQLPSIMELQQVVDEAQRSLNLEQGYLLRAVLLDLPDNRQRLLLVVHHLVVDGVSWRVLLEDLQQAYQALATGQPVKLPAKTNSFKAWAEHLKTYAGGSALRQELDYWHSQLQGINESLPCDRPDGGRQLKHVAYAATRLNKDQTQKLLQQAPQAYRTQVNDLLLTALARVIGRWTGRSDVLVRLEGHGREDLFEDIDLTRTVGWFTSMYPVRLSAQEDVSASVKGIKEQLRSIPNKGIGYGLLRYLGSSDAREMLKQLPQGEIVFNYLGQFDGSFDTEAGLFAPAREGSGTTQSQDSPLGSLLALNGQVYKGELSLSWTFSREVFDELTVKRLADEYAEELEVLIEHCCDESNRGVTPSDFPLAKLGQEQLDSLPVLTHVIVDIYPLSPMQQGMLFHTLYNQESGDYINQMRVDVEGLDADRFRLAWESTLEVHEILRSGFVWQGDLERPVQIVHKSAELPFVTYDWRAQQHLDDALINLAECERKQGFDLARAPLLRLVVVRTGDNVYHLIYTCHHILMDGWSNSRLLGEVLQRYAGHPPAKATGSYRDYITWLERQDPEASESFWSGQLAELEEPTRLAQAILSESDAGRGHGDHYQVFDAKQTDALKRFAQRHKVTVNTLVQAAWLLLLQHYTGQASVCFGATVAGRPAELVGVEEQIGLFINTLPVIGSPCPEQSVAEWIQQVQERNLVLREFEHTPLYEVQRWAGLGGEALFDSLLVFENYPVSEALQQGAPSGLSFGEVASHEQTNYPLTLAVGLGETLSVHYSHDRALLGGEAIQRIAGHFSNLLEALVGDKQVALGELPLLSEEEQHQILVEWNRTEAGYPDDQCIHQLIEAQVERTPDAVAVVFGGQEMTYQEMNKKANQLAHKLRELGVGPDILVGIAVERSLEMVIGLLAILKAGGAYVPFDPDYPQERLAYMLEDSGVGLLLTQENLKEQLPIPESVQCVALEAASNWLAGYSDADLESDVLPGNLAYVIYTSGSTGRPKGVAVRHSSLTNHMYWMQARFEIQRSDRVLQKTAFSFDASVWEFWLPLLVGAQLHMASPELLKDLPTLWDEVEQRQITILQLVPSLLQVLLSYARPQSMASIRMLFCGGEALSGTLVQRLSEIWSGLLVNLYGPTEATIDSCFRVCGALESPSVGRPIDNAKVYITGGNLNALPVGRAGELLISGVPVARGYHARPALTAERFIPDPFDEQGGGRLYRSGDLARYRNDGVIEYVGRIDHQVKIRGFRIELGEIEARLQEHEAVREAAVIDVEGPGGNQLAAYLVVDTELTSKPEWQAILRGTLRDYLKDTLPDYMVPTHLVFIEAMPLTPNGKLNRKALPKPDASQSQQAYVAPQSELEQQIAAIWADVLKVEQIGLSDHFFELGGHSLLATQVVVRIRNQVGVDVALRELFEHPYLAHFSKHLASKSSVAVPLQAELTKSLEALKRLSSEEIDELTS
ncbi:non-ribosomal peptide synthase/polyketide synthase, partial [Stutzerimonas kirkiae]|uniref:non-ribosomal peptide synthase/polyketide synthase n=1 Tax=Stutzerimonas kirkiae TaxID=2211392 RepID=UPI001038599E